MKMITFFYMWLFSIGLLAQVPEGYYDGTNSVNGTELKSVLHNIINNHVEYSYTFLRDVLLPYSDEDPENSNNVILIYTGWSRAKSAFGGGVSNWNREHTWAKSHGGFGDSPPMGTDAHHMRPCDVSVNTRRGNLDFDNGGTHYIDGDGPTYCYVTNVSWEPRDEDKGDVARIMLYMAVRYEGTNGELDLELVDYVNSSPSGQPLHGKLSTLLSWHHQDPVDEWEIRRNNRVYEYQENRNPFIDRPDFVARIWEGVSAEQYILPTISNLDIFPNPFNPSTTIRLNNLNEGMISVTIYNAKGQQVKALLQSEWNHTSTIELIWHGDNDQHFFVSSGIYYCLAQTGKETFSKKILLLK